MKKLLVVALILSGALCNAQDTTKSKSTRKTKIELTDFEFQILEYFKSEKKIIEEKFKLLDAQERLAIQMIADHNKITADKLKEVKQEGKTLVIIHSK